MRAASGARPTLTVTGGNSTLGAMPADRRSRRRRDTVRERRAHRELRRDALLDAAVEAIRRHGPGVSMEQVAAAGGVTKPVLYRHIGGLEPLVQALTDRFVGELVERLRAAIERDDEPRALLAAGIDAYLALIERETELYRFLVQRVGSEPGAHEVLSRVVRRIAQVNVEVIGERLREVGADSGAAEPWGYGVVGMVHAAGDWWLEQRTMPRRRLVEYLVNFAWSGMSGAVDGPEPPPNATGGTGGTERKGAEPA